MLSGMDNLECREINDWNRGQVNRRRHLRTSLTYFLVPRLQSLRELLSSVKYATN